MWGDNPKVDWRNEKFQFEPLSERLVRKEEEVAL
jgi:hypothetical protein